LWSATDLHVALDDSDEVVPGALIAVDRKLPTSYVLTTFDDTKLQRLCCAQSLLLNTNLRAVEVGAVFRALKSGFTSSAGLQSLTIPCIHDMFADDLVDVLRQRRSSLQQMQLSISSCPADAFRRVCEAVSELSLTALSVGTIFFSNLELAASVSKVLPRLKDSLEFLELYCSGSELTSHMCRNLVSFPRLRVLRIYGVPLNEVDMRHLCRALDKSSRLSDICANCSTYESGVELCHFFGTFRPLKIFRTSLVRFTSELLMQLFVNLRINTRVEELSLDGDFDSSVLIASGLIDSGWPVDVRRMFGRVAENVVQLATRNKERHASCRKLCVVLLAARKSNKCLTLVPRDVVKIIARYLLQTRNKSDWDN